MIKHIIFDLGRVLIGFDPINYLRRFHIPEEQIRQIIKECFSTELWNELDRGTYTYKEAADIVGERCPELDSIIHQALGNEIYQIFTELEPGISFLQKCIQQNYSCYYLTNFGSEGFQYVSQHFDFFKGFSGGTASYEIHSIKPEKDIYLHLLNKYALLAEECIFIDDNEQNVIAANALGFHGIVYTEHTNLDKEMIRILASASQN